LDSNDVLYFRNPENLTIKEQQSFWTYYCYFTQCRVILVSGDGKPGFKVFTESELGWFVKYNGKLLERMTEFSELGWFEVNC
jgi:hypothetical protein